MRIVLKTDFEIRDNALQRGIRLLSEIDVPVDDFGLLPFFHRRNVQNIENNKNLQLSKSPHKMYIIMYFFHYN